MSAWMVVSEKSPHAGSWMVQSVPFNPLFSMWEAKTGAAESMPKKTGFCPCTSATVRSISSSPFKTTANSGCKCSNISVFACKIPSRDPRFSRCAYPILVMTQTFGRAISARRCISPKWSIPISRTAISSSSVRRKIVSGSPISLL